MTTAPVILADAAVRYLGETGLQVLDRNWNHPGGCLHIVAACQHTLVICEIRYRRRDASYKTPLAAISKARHKRLRDLAATWMTAHGTRYDQIRIDVIGLVCDGPGGFTIEHIKAAS